MKLAAICDAIKEMNSLGAAGQIQHVLVDTGQHYDHDLSDSFFNDLELPKPDLCLGGGLGLSFCSDGYAYGAI
jgi:UDP-N-acetylglucosamine 2-epimerase